MIFQGMLVIALLVILGYAYAQFKSAPLVSVTVAGVTLAGLGLAVVPEFANDIAHMLGIGRGADLVLYCFVVIALAAIFNLHLRLRAHHERVTQLARAIAIANARSPLSASGEKTAP